MSAVRVVWRVRCTVTGGWKLKKWASEGPVDEPRDFATRKDALGAARFVKRWRLVKVTIRSKKQAPTPPREGA